MPLDRAPKLTIAPAEFLLGCSAPSWAWRPICSPDSKRPGSHGPLFISWQELRRRKGPWPRALVPVFVDSGGFTELSTRGRWTIPAGEYVAGVRRLSAQLGTVGWCAIQDWMCEPHIIHGGPPPGGGKPSPGTGLTVEEHQRRTIASLLELRALAPDIQWTPVVQGFEIDDYLQCVDMYDDAGVDLRNEPIVGVGSVCRRQSTDEIGELFRLLFDEGLERLHGFGVKAEGLIKHGYLLKSADSLAWARRGMKATRDEGIRDPWGGNLASSQWFAERWRKRMEWAAVESWFRQGQRPGHPTLSFHSRIPGRVW